MLIWVRREKKIVKNNLIKNQVQAHSDKLSVINTLYTVKISPLLAENLLFSPLLRVNKHIQYNHYNSFRDPENEWENIKPRLRKPRMLYSLPALLLLLLCCCFDSNGCRSISFSLSSSPLLFINTPLLCLSLRDFDLLSISLFSLHIVKFSRKNFYMKYRRTGRWLLCGRKMILRSLKKAPQSASRQFSLVAKSYSFVLWLK